MNRKMMISALVLSGLMGGCSIAVPGPEQSATAPHLNGDIGSTSNVWNDANLFGPVPASQQVAGDQACAAQNWGKATGFHARAQDASGRTAPNGGYMCQNGTSAQIAAREERIKMAGNRPTIN